MFFNIRGLEIEIDLPKSIAEADHRISELKILVTREQHAQSRRKRYLTELMTELQILKNWRKNADIQIQKELAASRIVNTAELTTEKGLIRHLYLVLSQLSRSGVKIEGDSQTVVRAARHWLWQNYSKPILDPEHFLDPELLCLAKRETGVVYREWGGDTEDPQEQTRMAMQLISKNKPEIASIQRRRA